MQAGRTDVRRVAVCILALASACAAQSALAGQSREEERRLAKVVRRGRTGVVLLRTATGICSGVALEDDLVATSKARLRAAGQISTFVFRLRKAEDGRETVDRVELGEAKIVRIHRSADAALLRIIRAGGGNDASGLDPFPAARALPAPGSEVTVCGTAGAVRFEDAFDLDARGGKVLGGTPAAEGAFPISAPVHRNSAGGAVLDAEGRLVGVASCPEGARAQGQAVPVARFEELRSGPRHALSAAATAEHVAPRPGPPPYLALSDGGPEGRRVGLGHGAFAIKETRALLASGIVIRDQHDPLEYVWCPIKKGKLHETVVASDAGPTKLNMALVMLGYESGGGVEQLGDAKNPRGDRMRVYVEWDWNEARAIRRFLDAVDPPWKRPDYKGVLEKVRDGAIKWQPGPRVRVRAEDLVFDRVAGRPMDRVDWIYTGGRFVLDEDTQRHYYEATENGVFAAVYRDPSAVLNHALKGGEDDTYYCVDDTIVPPRGTRCTLIILPVKPKDKPDK